MQHTVLCVPNRHLSVPIFEHTVVFSHFPDGTSPLPLAVVTPDWTDCCAYSPTDSGG